MSDKARSVESASDLLMRQAAHNRLTYLDTERMQREIDSAREGCIKLASESLQNGNMLKAAQSEIAAMRLEIDWLNKSNSHKDCLIRQSTICQNKLREEIDRLREELDGLAKEAKQLFESRLEWRRSVFGRENSDYQYLVMTQDYPLIAKYIAQQRGVSE